MLPCFCISPSQPLGIIWSGTLLCGVFTRNSVPIPISTQNRNSTQVGALEWCYVILKGEISCGRKWLVSIKYKNFHSFKEGLILLCQSILETRRITHLHDSAHFIIPTLYNSTLNFQENVVAWLFSRIVIINSAILQTMLSFYRWMYSHQHHTNYKKMH